MSRNRRRELTLDALEARAAPVGFYTGPSPVPRTIFLGGTIPASASVQTLGTGAETILVSGSGRVRPMGRTSLVGALHVSEDAVSGTLSLHSARTNVILRVDGPIAQASSSPSTLRFEIVQGRGTPPGNFAYILEAGSGSVSVTLPVAPASGRLTTVLTFQSP